MELDLNTFLHAFPFEPGRVNARLVRGADGREFLQVRVELGVLQLTCGGRPDGLPSVLEAVRQAPGGGLDSATCAAIRLELGQLQQRAVAFMAVGDAMRALADANAMLEGVDIVGARGPALDREWAESGRFSVLVLRTRCAAGALVSIGRPRDAASALDAGLGHLRDAAERIGIGAAFDSLSDVVGLRTLRDTLVPQLPPAQRTELEERLRAAVRAENYELAAILRDELRLMERVTD
jgi:hypothetical protein